MYYRVNYKASRRSTDAQLARAPQTRAVVFDFGGTLSRTHSIHSTWERMWLAAGYNITDAGRLLRQFTSKQITHQQWCDRTRDKLRERGFSRRHMQDIIADIAAVPGLASTMRTLHDRGIALYVVSGSLREVIVRTLGDTLSLLTEVKANDISYDDSGVIKDIKGHPFDFEGKAIFIQRVVKELGCNPLDVLFVGNSLNDTWASQSGARTLCVNPSDVDFTDISGTTAFRRCSI
jgi:phosphoserine phosphatase